MSQVSAARSVAGFSSPAVAMVMEGASMPACFIASATAVLTANEEKVAALTLSTTGEFASRIRSRITGKARSITTFVSWFSPRAMSVMTPLSMVTVRSSFPP